MKALLATAALALLATGAASAADTRPLRIESEAQFARDYADVVERQAPGVYLFVRGPFAGKTVTMGEAGLDYDLAALRARVPASRQERQQIRALAKQLEAQRARIDARRRVAAAEGASAKTSGGAFSCFYNNPRSGDFVVYSGVVQLTATTEFYLDNGGGGLNPYYARASATASGTTFRPYGVPQTVDMSATAYARNNISGQTAQRSAGGVNAVSVSAGYVYSGPDFVHDLVATSTLFGIGNCAGYFTLSDTLKF